MSKPLISEQLRTARREPRAVVAWNRVHPSRTSPKRLEILKLRNKSTVYRLVGAGPRGASVIAKRSLADTARVERIIHQEFMSQFHLPSLRYYGFLEESDGEYCWLFLENAAGEAYSPLSAEHRVLAANWLAALHTAALNTNLNTRLPSREPSDYLDLLTKARTTFQQHLSNPVMLDNDLRTLDSLISHCDIIESHWSELEEACDRMPRALVHGDFVIKNVSVQQKKSGPALLAFDWELAGWGVPATDLAQFTGRTVSPDLSTYYSSMKLLKGRQDLHAVHRLAESGRFFPRIDDIFWATKSMAFDLYQFILKPMFGLMSYESRIAWALKEANWNPPMSHSLTVNT